MLCKYKNALGEPGKGFHNHFGTPFAVLDVLGTIVIILVLCYYFRTYTSLIILSVIVLTIFLHYIFCVETTVNKFLFG